MKNNKAIYLFLALLCVWCPLFMGAFDKDKPSSSTSLRSSNPEILANWSALETAIGNEHEFSTGGANTGDHTQGSARSFSQATAPTTQIDSGAFASTDLGSLWVDTDDNAFYMLTATTPTWTPVSTEVIATMLASARVFGSTLGVTGILTASGAVTVGTTLDVTGNIDPTSYETTNGGFLDEDAMSSDSATKVASQQSIKAYIDTQITAAKTAVGWTHDGSTTISLTTLTGTYQDVDTGIGGRGIAFLKVKPTEHTMTIFFKTKGETDTESGQTGEGMGCSAGRTEQNRIFYVWVETDSSGVAQAKKLAGNDGNVTVTVMGYLLTP